MLGLGLALFNLNHYVNSPSNNVESVHFIIPKGYSVKKIADALVEQKVITHPKLFWLTHRFLFKSCPLQAGEYQIPPKSSIRTLIEFMNEGKVVVHKFTIVDGITMFEVLEKVKNEPMLNGEITKNYDEGEFLADTYNFTYGETRDMFLHRIYVLSQAKIDQLWNSRKDNLPFSSKEQAVTLASIIDKETGLAEERRKVASVFINRLRKGMRLQADPTVIYAITLGKGSLNRSLTKSDLKIKSPYNTYVNIGLPPTPICTPGVASLEAALNPSDTKDLYFVVNGQGGHNFSSNLSDHNQHVGNYRKLKAGEKQK